MCGIIIVMKIKNMLTAACLAAAGFAFADTTPVMVSLVTPVQAPSRDYDVKGLKLSLIYGECASLKGVDIGIINNTKGDFSGIAIGGANVSGGRMLGGQIGLLNIDNNAKSDWESMSIGVQGGLVNYAGPFCGLQDGIFASVVSGDITGGQIACVNVADGVYGCQLGFLNIATDVHGVQMGLYGFLGVNFADKVSSGCQLGLLNVAGSVNSGIQVGLINVNTGNGWFPVLPIINGGF